MPGFCVYMFDPSPFRVPAAEVERGMSCYNLYYYVWILDFYLGARGFDVFRYNEH